MDNPHPLLERLRGVVRRQQLKRLENSAQKDDSSLALKSILVSIVAAVVLVGCGPSVDIRTAAAHKPHKK
jgi:hypothetical protein